MPNRFKGCWASYLQPFGGTRRPDGRIRIKISANSEKSKGKHTDSEGDPFDTFNSNPQPPNPMNPPLISFTRTFGGRVYLYTGFMTTEKVEPEQSHIIGMYTISLREDGVSTLAVAESGDWTANRPPPDPPDPFCDGPFEFASKGKAKKSASSKKGGSNKSASGKKSSAGTKSKRGKAK